MIEGNIVMMGRLFLIVNLMLLAGCTIPNPADLPEVVSERYVRPDHRDRIAQRLLWLAPERPWHYNCLFQKPLADLTLDEQKLALASADLLFRAHFEEKRLAYRSAGHLFRQVADHGVPLAYVRLGNLLVDGKGVQPNPKGGLKVMLQAARLDCAMAQHRYGELVANGVGQSPDLVKAWTWLDQAHKQGYEESKALMVRLERFMGPALVEHAKEQSAVLRSQLDLFNTGEDSLRLVECVTDRNRTPFITRMRACHAMGGTHSGQPIDYRSKNF
jgi:hypothetical protein